MFRKLLVLAITSGLAAKLYRRYVSQRQVVAEASPPVRTTRRRRAGSQGSAS